MPAYAFKKEHYPWTRQFFDRNFPRIPSLKPRVLQAFGQYSGLRPAEMKIPFRSGYFPTIKVREKPGAYGFAPPTANEIWLGRTFIRELELALGPNRVSKNPRRYAPSELEDKLFLILEATVLHEMVHYFRRKTLDSARLAYSSNVGRGREEWMAQRFEKAAYKFRPSVHTLAIAKYLPQTAKEITW